jgi:hypothetical protein
MSDDQISNDQHFAMDLVAAGQRSDINDRLKALEEQNKGIADCPYCAGPLPKQGVEKCRHCGSNVVWFGEGVAKEGEIEKAKQLDANIKRGRQQAEERRILKQKQTRRQIDFIVNSFGIFVISVAVICLLAAISCTDGKRSQRAGGEFQGTREKLQPGEEPLWKKNWKERQRKMANTLDNAAPPSESP